MPTNTQQPLDDTLSEVLLEVVKAERKHPPMASAHEGYSVILEELDELWDEVKKQNSDRSYRRMRKEATQIAAMAIRFMRDVATFELEMKERAAAEDFVDSPFPSVEFV